jgi:preprotein translocase subunit SecY
MIENIINTFRNCFKIPELKSRIFFTFIVLAIARVVSMIPVPGLDGAALSAYFDKQQDGGGLLGMYSMFTGGALERCAIGALGIMPYISATIILQLLTAVVPQLSKLAREEGGRTKIIQYGRYMTVVLCLGQAFFTAIGWENPEILAPGIGKSLVLYDNLWWYRIQTAILITTGTMLLMWLGEQITERGIGNGVSLIISVGILARLPRAVQAFADMFKNIESTGPQIVVFKTVVLFALLLVVVAGVIAITQAQRKVAVQYAQRAVGRKVVQGQTSYLPLRLNFTGVMPIIFAGAILMLPQQLLKFAGAKFEGMRIFQQLADLFQERSIFYIAVYALLILFFSYFWVATQFNEIQIADDLKKYGGYIPGVRPGQATADFLHNAMSRITLAGAVFMIVIAILPTVLNRWMNVDYNIGAFFGGTSVLILVGVMLDTMRQMESHLLMRHYDGFLKKGRLKGRF